MSSPDIAFTIHVATINSQNETRQGGWRARVRRAQKQKQACFWPLAKHVPRGTPLALPILVTLTRVSAGTMDDDGLRNALKHVRDAIANWVGIDDGDTTSIAFRYLQERGPKLTRLVRVQISPATRLYEHAVRVVP
jgi:hypothetical protein